MRRQPSRIELKPEDKDEVRTALVRMRGTHARQREKTPQPNSPLLFLPPQIILPSKKIALASHLDDSTHLHTSDPPPSLPPCCLHRTAVRGGAQGTYTKTAGGSRVRLHRQPRRQQLPVQPRRPHQRRAPRPQQVRKPHVPLEAKASPATTQPRASITVGSTW